MVEAIQQFHDQNPEIALRVDVKRHPYSFKGGDSRIKQQKEGTDDETWKWMDDLNIYAGDELHSLLLRLGMTPKEVEQLRRPGGLPDLLERNGPPRVLQVLERASTYKRYSKPMTVENLKAAVSKMTPDQLTTPHRVQVSEIDIIAGDAYKENLGSLGQSVDISFDFDVDFQWYPVASQRVLLYAHTIGAQEAFADALARRHFTQGKATGSIETVLDAAKEVGLDYEDVKHMLVETERYKDDVWNSYRDMTDKYKIRSIPKFTFVGPATPTAGLFRGGSVNSGEVTISGSGNAEQFVAVFEHFRDEQIEDE